MNHRALAAVFLVFAPLLVAGCFSGSKTKANEAARSLRATSVDGVYHLTVTAQQQAKNDHIPVAQEDPANYGDFVLVLDRRRFASTTENKLACTWQYGRVTLRDDVMDWTVINGGGTGTQAFLKPGEFFGMHWSLYRRILSLRPFTPPDVGPQAWYQVSSTPTAQALNRGCGLPKQAFP
jgi:hypothetical protein